MTLLRRVANSQANRERTIAALRLIIAQLERDLNRPAPGAGQKAPERNPQKGGNF